VLLAALVAGAGVIHLVMAPIHADASIVEAATFAWAGWVQLALAVALILRPSRAWLVATVAANLVFLAAWAVSRTAGLPFGAHPGEAEAVGSIDLTVAVFEALAITLAALALARPRLGAGLSSEARLAASLVPLSVLGVVTMTIVSPDTARHRHDTVEVAAPASTIESRRCDKAFNPVSYWEEAERAGVDTVSLPEEIAAVSSDGHDHGSGSMTTATTLPPDPLEGRGSVKLDKVVSKLGSESEIDAAAVVVELADFDDVEYEAFLYQLRKQGAAHSAHATSGDDTGGHGGHMGPTPWVAMTDQEQCDKLRQELDLARDTALKYPTAADAEAAGWRKVTPYVPGIAAHYMNFKYVDGTFNIEEPEMLLYDGNGPDAAVVGLSYYILHRGEAEPTQGFTGDNDHFHRHIGLCIKDGLVIDDSTSTEEECAAAGGRKQGGGAGWMNHVWVIPGCESPWGMFSGATPVLDRQLGERSGTDGGGCAGSKARARYDLSPGQPSTATGPSAEAQESAATK
jgi:hypothetical protein